MIQAPGNREIEKDPGSDELLQPLDLKESLRIRDGLADSGILARRRHILQTIRAYANPYRQPLNN